MDIMREWVVYLHKEMVEEAAPAAGMLQEEVGLLLQCFAFFVGKDVLGLKGLVHRQEYWVEVLRVGAGRGNVDGDGWRLFAAIILPRAAPYR